MAKPKTKEGVFHIFSALSYSLQGLRAVWHKEEAFRLEVYIYGPFLVLAFFVGSSPFQISILIVSVLLIFMMEFVNSAIEATIDRIGDEIHPLSKNAKDFGSASITIVLIIFAVLWIAALYEKFGVTIFG